MTNEDALKTKEHQTVTVNLPLIELSDKDIEFLELGGLKINKISEGNTEHCVCGKFNTFGHLEHLKQLCKILDEPNIRIEDNIYIGIKQKA